MQLHSIRRTLTATCLVIAGSIGVSLGAAQTGAGDQLELFVTVVAPAKGPVTDLTAKDFKVEDGKQSIPVAAAEHATTPLSIVLVVENTQPGTGAAPRARELRTSLHSFVDVVRAGTADAKIGIFTDAGASVPIVALNASPADLDNAIDQLTPSPQREGALIEGLANAAKILREVPAPRRAIVTMDVSAPDPTARTVLSTIYGTVLLSRATLWSVSVGRGASATPSREMILDDLTSATGGERKIIVGASGLESQMKAVANSLLSQYTLHVSMPAGDVKALKIDTPKGKALVAGVVQLR